MLRPRPLTLATIVLAVVLALAASGCGSDDKAAKPVVPQAKTEKEWVTRLVDRFLRAMDRDLTVLNGLRTPQAKIYLLSGNETSIRVVRRRMTDLKRCSAKLDRVGTPPGGNPALGSVYRSFRRACPHYERTAKTLLDSLPLLVSADPADRQRGEDLYKSLARPSRLGAQHFSEGLATIQRKNLLAEYQPSGTG